MSPTSVAFTDDPPTGMVTPSASSRRSQARSSGEALNDYLYLLGDDLKDLQRNGPVTIRVGEKGPLVASLVVESAAPGCRKLVRELRVVAGLDYVEIINTVDKERLRARSYRAKEGKESVNFAFPFAATKPTFRYEIPGGVVCANTDMLPGACLESPPRRSVKYRTCW